MSTNPFDEIMARLDRIEGFLIQLKEPTPQQKKGETQFITRKEAAKILKVSLPTLHSWVKSGQVRAYRIGHLVRFKEAEIESSLSQIQTSQRMM